MESKETTVYITSLNNVKKSPTDKKFLITRSSKNADYAIKSGWVYKPELAPSWNLFNKIKEIKERGEWHQVAFNTIYKPIFIEEMKNQDSLTELKKLITMVNKGEDITLVCYCPKSKMCHTSIIGEIIQKITKCKLVSLNN